MFDNLCRESWISVDKNSMIYGPPPELRGHVTRILRGRIIVLCHFFRPFLSPPQETTCGGTRVNSWSRTVFLSLEVCLCEFVWAAGQWRVQQGGWIFHKVAVANFWFSSLGVEKRYCCYETGKIIVLNLGALQLERIQVIGFTLDLPKKKVFIGIRNVISKWWFKMKSFFFALIKKQLTNPIAAPRHIEWRHRDCDNLTPTLVRKKNRSSPNPARSSECHCRT